MDVTTIDHVNLRIPPESVNEVMTFYRKLDFEVDGLAEFQADELPFFDVRLNADQVIHFWPDQAFTEPSGDNYDHISLVVDHPIDELETLLDDADLEIEDRNPEPRGAATWKPSVYVRDPVGYSIELKEHHRHTDYEP
jgi:catechol 2,3-dioxygenase-like lactoylglutathione lyase family enzyme